MRPDDSSDPARSAALNPNRRDFFVLAGSGLFLLFDAGPLAAQEPGKLPESIPYLTDFNLYLRIGPDGRITCMVGRVELGQGAMTSLAQLLAEELDVTLDSVDMVMGDTDLCPWDPGTYGSLSMFMFGPVLRAAGAEARAILLEMAAERLQAPAGRLQVRAGVITDASAPAKRITYAELVQGKHIERHLKNVPLKSVPAFTIVGHSPQPKDRLEKITGKAKYSGDVTLPGMLNARILRPPAHGAILKTADTAAAEKVSGARVVRDGDLVAVLHERRDLAGKARDMIQAQYERPVPAVDDKTIFDWLLKKAPTPELVGKAGSLADGERLAATIVEETYLNSYVAHAPMETPSATAVIEGGKATVWASTQQPFPLKQEVARALGFQPENVRVITPYVGGAFGGKNVAPQAVEAARLAKATGKPVQVVYDRAEEFFYDTFRPAAVVKIRSGLTAAGKIVFWDFKVYGAGGRESKQFYDIPHHLTVSAGGWHPETNPPGMNPFNVGPWRAPAASTNTFARESHIDILAAGIGADPVEFRMRNLNNDRMRRVLETATKQFGWKPGRAPGGRGAGVACGIYSGTYVATVAEVAVNRSTGAVEVKRIVTAQDAGVVVNPEGTRQQLEGCITMGLGYALSEEIHFHGGDILDRNFDDYRIPRFSWLPKIETILIDNPELPPQSSGEPSVITMGAVIANAIFDAVGVRLLQLPMTPARIQAALKTLA